MSQLQNKVTDMPAHVFLAAGIFLPLVIMLVSDWLHVKYNFSTMPDWAFWVSFLLLSYPCFYFGFKKLNTTSFYACLLATLTCFVCALLMVFIVLNFHLLIGGQF